jgi:hypothetical protein
VSEILTEMNFFKENVICDQGSICWIGGRGVNPGAEPAYHPKLIGVARGVATLTYEEATPFKRYYKYIILTLSFGGNMGGQASIWGGLATPDHSLSLSRRDWFVTFKVIKESLHFHMLNLSAGQTFI